MLHAWWHSLLIVQLHGKSKKDTFKGVGVLRYIIIASLRKLS